MRSKYVKAMLLTYYYGASEIKIFKALSKKIGIRRAKLAIKKMRCKRVVDYVIS